MVQGICLNPQIYYASGRAFQFVHCDGEAKKVTCLNQRIQVSLTLGHVGVPRFDEIVKEVLEVCGSSILCDPLKGICRGVENLWSRVELKGEHCIYVQSSIP